MFPLVLSAVDISQIVGACVLVISVLSWVVNVVQGNTPDGAPRAKQPKPKPQGARSEIEMLLQQLAGEKSKPKQERQQPPKPPKPQQQDRSRGKSKPSQSRPSTPSGPLASRQQPRVSDSHLKDSRVGNDVRSSHLGNRIDALVQSDVTGAVEKDIQAAVQHDLGNAIAPATIKVAVDHPLIAVLRDPKGVRQAILLNEILQRPKALRK